MTGVEPATSMGITLGYVVPVVGLATVFATWIRAVTMLGSEFGDEQPVVRNPLSVAACTGLSYDRFRENDWAAYAALWAGMRFRAHYDRFYFLLNPKMGNRTAVELGALQCIVFVIAWEHHDVGLLGITGGLATLIGVIWLCIIEQGKMLKKRVENLRVQ